VILISGKQLPSVFILVFLFFGLFAGCTEEKKIDTGVDFAFTSLNGETKHLSDYRGKVVILDMWATWCGPCKLQMIELHSVYENYSRDDVEILSIDIDQRESVELVQNFLSDFKYAWTFGLDNGSIWETYKGASGGIPTLCIFNRDGNLSFSHEGLLVQTKLTPILDTFI
jgi:thiol-disulfide isomerase/thioredoxin